MNTSRRWLVAAAAAVPAALLAGCAGLAGPRTVTISEAKLQALLARHFPLQRRLLLVFDASVPAPVLRLLPEQNRLGADFIVDVTDRLSGRSYRGHLDVETALRFEPADATLRLAHARVVAFDIESASASLNARARGIGSLLAEQVLDGLAVWQATPQQAERLRASGLEPRAVNVTTQGVEIALEPALR
jgi:hypothetical protein